MKGKFLIGWTMIMILLIGATAVNLYTDISNNQTVFDARVENQELALFKEQTSASPNQTHEDGKSDVITSNDNLEIHLDSLQAQPISSSDVSFQSNEGNKSEERLIYEKYAEQMEGDPFWVWPYDIKAAYSQEVWPVVAYKESMYAAVGYSTVYLYGIPSENEITYNEASYQAQKALQTCFGIDNDTICLYSMRFESYDITDAEKPRWKFTYINPAQYYRTWYRVEINGKTGEVVRADCEKWQQLVEQIDFKNEWLY